MTKPDQTKKAHRCCFTGHRPEKMKISDDELRFLLEREIRKAIDHQFTDFITGMARGVDLVAAEIVLRLREDNPRLKLICAVPHTGFGVFWGDQWSQRYLWVLSQADFTIELSPTYYSGVYQARNEWMVNRSGLLIAVFNGRSGGTYNTLEYARKCHVPCSIIRI